MTSKLPGPPGASATHDAHVPHGVDVGPCSQFSDRARIRAEEVLPQPRGPENKYAWAMRPLSSAVDSGRVTCSWPTTSPNVAGRYFLYSATRNLSVLVPEPVRHVNVAPPQSSRQRWVALFGHDAEFVVCERDKFKQQGQLPGLAVERGAQFE